MIYIIGRLDQQGILKKFFKQKESNTRYESPQGDKEHQKWLETEVYVARTLVLYVRWYSII